jgi:hypothetical protein
MTLIRFSTNLLRLKLRRPFAIFRFEIPLGSIEGMPKPCVVNCDNLRTISKAHLVKKIARLSQKRVHEVKRAVGYALAWEELIAAGE